MNIILFERERAVGDVTRLSLAEFKGHTFINLRNYFREGDELRPSKQGITFNSPELAEEISEALKKGANGLREVLEKSQSNRRSKDHL